MKASFCILVFVCALMTSALPQQVEEQPFSEEEIQQMEAAIREIASLKAPSEMPRSIELIRFVLTKITKEIQPEIWASLQHLLASSLCRNPVGDRADNIEQAIEHCGLALEVHTRERFPEDWAKIQSTLGIAFGDRIRGDPAENIERAIKHYDYALEVYNRERFPQEWGMTQNNLGNAYIDRIQGDRIENVERAIEHYGLALEIYVREMFPQNWAATHNNLCNAYNNRMRGDPAENTERAIKHCSLALKVYTRERFAQNWAATHNNLGLAYISRVRQDQAENVERAIEHHSLALEVYTREGFPADWAMTQANLGNAYRVRIRGELAENIEQAIEHCELALEVLTKERFPEYWRRTQANLGNDYVERIRGDRAENLERALEHYGLALEVYTKERFPEAWAVIQANLGTAYTERIRGDRAENVDQAIKHCELALEVCAKEKFPEYWAMTQISLGNAYSERVRGERAENVERALEHYGLALEVYTRERFPGAWAGIQTNLGNAYIERIRGERAENVERALEHYGLALEVCTRERFTESWAGTQANLGTAYTERIRGDRADNLERAIEHYSLALEVRTQEAFPADYIQTAVNLAGCHLQRWDWQGVCEVCLGAEGIGEELVGLAAGEEVQAKYLSNIRSAFVYHSYALAKLAQCDSALDVLEKGKARGLNEALLLQRISSSALTPETQEKLTSLRQGILSLEQQLKGIGGEGAGQYVVLAQERRRLQSQLRELLQTIRQQLALESVGDWDARKVLESCQKEGIVTVSINVTPVGALLLVSSTRKEDLTPLFLEALTTDSLDQITWSPADRDSTSLSWIQLFPQSEGDWPRWIDEQPRILARLGQWLWPELDRFLQEQKIDRVLLIPQGDLFLYPLHATPFIPLNSVEHMPIYPLERYTISYAPSLRVYDQLTRTSAANLVKKEALFVEDPDGKLGFSFAGQQQLLDKMRKGKLAATLLHGFEITSDIVLDHMKDAALIHYYGHGYYDWLHPESSGLKMYSPGEELNLLTMEEISQTLSAGQAELVVLCACETGMTDVLHSHWREQFVGLPAGFLRAGASTVVGSLWRVPKTETHILFSRFYEELLSDKEGMCPAEALREAQLWMLRAGSEQIDEAGRTYLGLEPGVSQIKPVRTKEWVSNPVNWAAFYVVGNGFAPFE